MRFFFCTILLFVACFGLESLAYTGYDVNEIDKYSQLYGNLNQFYSISYNY